MLVRVAAPDRYDATITARSDLTEALAFFRVRPDDAPRAFVAGQYLTVGRLVQGRLVQRAYSVASSARRLDEAYELYIRLVPGGALTPELFRAGAGDRVSLRGPKGRFTLRAEDAERPHLFVATGCGIAPFMSMLRTLRDDGIRRRIVLLHGVSYARELAYRTDLERWSAEPESRLVYVPTVSRPADPRNAGWTGGTGRVERVLAPVCDRHRIDADEAVAYVCGNPEMTASVRELLRARGFAAERVHAEDYWPLRRVVPGP